MKVKLRIFLKSQLSTIADAIRNEEKTDIATGSTLLSRKVGRLLRNRGCDDPTGTAIYWSRLIIHAEPIGAKPLCDVNTKSGAGWMRDGGVVYKAIADGL